MTKPLSETITETIQPTKVIDVMIKTDLIESQQLLGASGKVAIQHRGEIYQLRQNTYRQTDPNKIVFSINKNLSRKPPKTYQSRQPA
ncbi:Hemin uptake protein [Providencia rustigianii]|nr:Hemin uptake protein [Providencia rustigianii]